MEKGRSVKTRFATVTAAILLSVSTALAVGLGVSYATGVSSVDAAGVDVEVSLKDLMERHGVDYAIGPIQETTIGSFTYNNKYGIDSECYFDYTNYLYIEDDVLYGWQNGIKPKNTLPGSINQDGTISGQTGTYIDANKTYVVILPDSVTTLGAGTYHYTRGDGSENWTGMTDSRYTSFSIYEGIESNNASYNWCPQERLAGFYCSSSSNLTTIEGTTSNPPDRPNPGTSDGSLANANLLRPTLFLCNNLRFCILPSGLETIGRKAFYGCSQVRDINVPEGVTTIGDESFANCGHIAHITLPSGIDSLSTSAFSNTAIRDVENLSGKLSASNFPGVMNYSTSAGNSQLFAIGSSDTDKGEQAVYFCQNQSLTGRLATISGANENYTAGRWYALGLVGAEDKQKTTVYEFPGTITAGGGDARRTNIQYDYINPDGTGHKNVLTSDITEYDIVNKFAYWAWFSNVIISDAVRTIGDDAFNVCHLQYLELGKNVQKIGANAFNGNNQHMGGATVGDAPFNGTQYYYFHSDLSNCSLGTNVFNGKQSTCKTRYYIFDNAADCATGSAKIKANSTSQNVAAVYTYTVPVKAVVDSNAGEAIVTGDMEALFKHDSDYTDGSYRTSAANANGGSTYTVTFTKRLVNHSANLVKTKKGYWVDVSTLTGDELREHKGVATPSLSGNVSTKWYTEEGYGTEVTEVNDLFTANVNDTVKYLYTRKIAKPTINTQAEYTFGQKDSDGNEIIGENATVSFFEALGISEDKITDYEIAVESFTFTGQNTPSMQAPEAIQNAGVYRLTLKLNSKWGEWEPEETDDFSSTVTVERKKITIATIGDLPEFKVAGENGARLGGNGTTLYRYSTGWYLSQQGDEAPILTADITNGYTYYAGAGTNISIDFIDGNNLEYEYSMNGATASQSGDYYATVTLSVKFLSPNITNYYFDYGAGTFDGSAHGVTVNDSSWSSIRFSKHWFVVTQTNMFVDSETTDINDETPQFVLTETGGVAVSSWTYEEGDYTVHTPKLAYSEHYDANTGDKLGDVQPEIQIEYTPVGGTTTVIKETTDLNGLAYYINAAMPAGKYVIKLTADAVTVRTGSEGAYEYKTYDAISNTYTITVLPKKLETEIKKEGGIFEILNGKTFSYAFDESDTKTVRLHDDISAEITALNQTLNVAHAAADADNYWKQTGNFEKYYDEFAVIAYNLNRWGNSFYVTEGLPTDIDSYTVYWAISAKNYEMFGGSEDDDRREKLFTTVIYKELDVTGEEILGGIGESEIYFKDVVYTGGEVQPLMPYSQYFKSELIEGNDYVNVQNGAIVKLTLINPALAKWKVPEDVARFEVIDAENGILYAYFNIVSAQNEWSVTPYMPSWSFNGYNPAVNEITSGLKFPTDKVTYYIGTDKTAFEEDGTLKAGSWTQINAANENTLKRLIPGEYYLLSVVEDILTAGGDVNVKGGKFLAGTLVGSLKEGEDYLASVNITKATNLWETSPNIVRWNWSEYNASVNVITGTPRYLNLEDKNLTGQKVYYTVLDSQYKAIEGLISFTLDGAEYAAVCAKLGTLDAGNYYLLATVNNTDYYTGLNELPELVEGGTLLNGDGLDPIPFDIAQKNNYWQVSPAMTAWRYEQFATANFREGEPAFPTTGKKVYYGIFENDITEKPVSVDAFNSLAGGKMFESIADVETYLRGLHQGDYYLAAYAAGDNNYTDLFMTVRFNVLTVENGWQTTPGITSWKYKGFTDANFIAGVPTYPKTNAQVTYGIFQTETAPEVSAFATCDHKFTDVAQLKAYLGDLEKGTYYLAAYVEKAANEDYDYLYLALRFTVDTATNSWETEPRLTGWTYKSFTEDNFTAGLATLRDNPETKVTYQILDENGIVKIGPFTDLAAVKEEINALGANKDTTKSYTLVVSYAGTTNYEDLTSRIPFRVTKANNSWQTTPGLTGWTFNTFTTANFTEGKAAFNEGNNYIQYVIKKSDGTQVVAFTNDPTGINIETVKSTLETLPYGHYSLDATLEGTDDHTGLEQLNITFQVTQMGNSWKTTPNLVGWQYKAFAEGNFTAGSPNYIAQGTVPQYGIFTANLNNSTEFTKADAGVKFETLNDEVTVDGKTMTVAKYLEELTVRTGTDAYYFAAYVPADGNDNYGELFLCVPFRVTPATTNAWTEAPSIGGWTYGDTQPGALLTKGTAAFGELVYSIHLSDAQGNPGAVVSGYEELSYDELVAKLNGAENQLSAVNYNLVVTTVENINYNTITYNVRFAVEKADNAWATVPTINGWTYGATAETPIEGITAHEPDEGQKSMAYYPAQQVNGVWVANTTAGAIENIATAGAGTYAYVFTAGETTNYKEVTHTAIFVISQKGNAWTVEPEGTLTWVWGFAEIGNTKLATAAAEENGDGVQYSIRNTQTNSIENPAGATIAEKLSNLGAGDYEITTSVGATDNYAGISKITYLTVTKANFVVESEILNTYGWEWDDATGVAIFGNPSITKAKETDAALITYIVTTESGRAETFTDYDLMSAYVLALGAGKHEIKITVTNTNYNDYTKTVAVNIQKATFSVTEKQTDTSWSWNEKWTAADGGRDIIPTTVLDKKSGQVKVQYAIGEQTFADFDALKTYLQGNRNVGKYTVAVSVAQEGYENYNDLGVSFTVTVTQAENRWLTEPQTELKKEYGTPLTADALVLAQAAFGTLTYTGYDSESGKTLLEWINELPSGTHTLTTGVAADDNGNYKGLTPITTVITVVGIGGTWDNENEGLRREYEFTYSSKLSEQMATVKIPVKTWDQYEELNGLPEDKSPKLTYSVTYVPYIGEAVSPVLDNTQTAVINYLGSAARQAGTYTIQVDYNPNNPNYATLSYTVTVRVLRSEISWATQPDGLYNKPYAGFEADVLTPNAGEGHKVVYDVSGTVNESNVAITDFRAYLNGLSVGEYTFTYSVAETNNYTGLETQTVTVTIYKAANDWVDATKLQKSHTAYRINGNYDTLVVPEALYGTVVTTLTAPDGRTSAPVYNETIKTFADWLASQNLAAGEYGISFAVTGTENYNGLLYECTLSVLKKDNAWTTDGEPASSYEWTGAAGTFKIPTPEVGATLLRFDITKAGDTEYTQTHQNLTQEAFETAIAALSYGTYTVTIRVGSDKGEEEPTAAIRNHNNDYNILIGTTTIVFERADNAFTTELSAIVKTFGIDVTLTQPVAKKGGETVVYTISGTTANGAAVATQSFAANEFDKFVAAINDLQAGTYTMTASIAQTNTYEAATTTAIVTVNKVTTAWNLTDDELNAYKGNLAFTWNNGAVPSDLLPELALSNWAQGVIRYTVDGKECVWTTELGTKDAGSYRITAYVEGDNNHTALSFETTVVINPVTTAWTAETAAQDGERINWIYKASTNTQPTQPALTQLSKDAGATITYVLANAENGTQLDSGDWEKVTATLKAQTAGTYTITAMVEKGTNHTALTFTSTVVISVAANDWKSDGHVGANATVTWVYGHHADNAAIVYEAEHNNDLLAITVNNVAVSGNLMDYLKAQSVGTYVIVASVPATAEYGALTETITLTIGKSTDNGWTNGGLVINDTWTWTDVSKHTADDMAGYYVGAELGLVMPIPKYGDRVLITVMSGATELFSTTVLYENGVANEAIVNALKNRLWALDAGSYTIIAQIPESENYAQSEESAVSFTVAQATNVWLESPAIGGWDFGGTTVYPTALPKFGNKNDVVYMYAPKNGREDITQILESEWKTTLPTQGGAYFIRGTLEGTNNYTALDKDAVNCYSTFSINTGDNKWVNNVSVVSWNWDGYNREVNLFGGSARSGGIVHYVIKKLVSGSEAVLDKDDFSIEITQEEWEKTIEKRLSDITLTEESDYKFVSEEIAALLNALKPGSYVLNAVVNADENYGALSAAVNFTVGKATNDWATNADGSAKLPGVVSFTYGAPVTTGDRVSFTAGEAKYGSVNYKITGTKNDETSYESAVLHTTDKVYDLFGGLDAGNYVLNVWFDADESLYSALYSAQSPYVLPFNVARANNSWNTAPATRLTEKYSVVQAEDFDFSAWFGTPAAAHEDIVYTILGTDFTTALAGEYSYANLYNDAILKLGAGEYIVRLTVGQSCNYNALTADVSLTLTRLTNSFTSIPSSFTGEWHLDADGVSNNSTIAITETTVTAEHGTIVYTFDNTPYTTVAGLQNAIKACNAGSYQITVSVEANNYYDGLSRTVQLDIAQGTNAWKDGWNVGTSLKAGNNVMSWAWNSAAEWTKGVPVYGTTVYVEIMKQGTTTALRRIPVDYSVDGGASSIEAINTFVSGLDKGLYNIVVTAPATANWSELKTRAEDAVFEVTQAANGWETAPYLYNATENKYVYGTAVQPYAEALHGTVEYKYYAKTTSGYSPLAAVPVNAGDYKVEFIVTEPATGNYAKIEGEIDFTIEKAEVTSYIVSPSASGWIWNGYNRLSNLFTAIPTSGGAVTYSILHSNGNVVVADIRLADALGVHHGDFDKDIYVTADKAQEIAALDAGRYTLRVDVAEVANYKSFYTTVNFDITEAENTWIVAPQLVGWAQNNWNAEDYTPMATSRFGEVTIYVRNKINGDVYYERSYNSATGKYEVKINQLNLAKAGRLVMTASVAKSPNQYHATNEDGEFVDLEGSIEVEIYPVGSSENNVWLTSPGIVGWEANVEAPVNLPYGEPLRGWAYFVFYDAEGHEIVAGEDSYLVEKGDSYYRDFYVPMAPGTYRMEAFAVNEDIEGNVIEADNLHARNITLIISHRKNSFTLEPRIPTLLYLGEKNDKTKWVDPTATAALADSTITFTYTLKETGEEYHDLNDITKDGTYTLKAVVEAKYCIDLTFTVDFEVALSQNSWIDIPVVKDWSEEDGPVEPEGKPEFGEIVYEYFEKRGDELIALEGKPTREGSYVLRATAYQEGFTPLVNEFEFTVTPTFDSTLLAVDISLACVLCALTVVVIVFAIRRYKENG